MSLDGLLLLAAAEDVIFFLIVILFLVIGGLTQLFRKLQEAQRPAQRPRPGVRPGGVRPNVPPGQDPVRAEIERFLREAADKRGGARPPQTQRAGPRPAQAQRPAPAGRAQPPAETPILLEPIETVPEPIRAQAPSQPFRGVASGVGAGLGDALGVHVHGVFDHELSTLHATPEELAAAAGAARAETPEEGGPDLPPTAAAGLAAMLAEPVGLRQAIVLNEILQRPEHRWR